ncbi:DUF4232 domain-containing protein [Georgenia subflava]|uniref:DUF4232 domain-containing protein n=1 Tax=Georgenia subflava TaxID=1622177 RepID=A0A6N7EHF3_9MICO|nr:DUF4232 domain-containing protein [Georgenia subflava]MPV35576.1 DUF4232 domain-containing protein [Georgenia subflava]
MRLLRAWAPALLAAALWLGSAGLEYAGRRTLSGPVRHMLSLVAPETIPVGELTAPAPWGVVMAGLSCVAVAAAYAVILSLVRRRSPQPGTGPTALAAYWFCAVAAGSVVAAIPVLAELVVALRERSVPFGLASEHLVGVAHWGLVWGWAPALLALALDMRQDGSRPAHRRRASAVPAAAVLVVAAVGLLIAAPQADAARQAAIPTGTAEPEPAPTGTPVPPVALGEWQIDPLWCTTGQLEFAASPVEPALGSRAMTVTATNVSDAACVLESYPDIAFSDPVTSALDVRIDHGGTMLNDDAGPVRIEIAPGSHARTTLGWGAMSTAGREGAGWLHIAAYHGAERQMVQVDTDITGGAVTVTAWQLRAG